MLNILLVLYHDFSSNSAVHVHHFSNNLINLGLDCVVAVPWNKNTVPALVNPLYKVTEFKEVHNLKQFFSNKKEPDIVHIWTPREIVRTYWDRLKKLYKFKLVIHLEDNEEHLVEKFLQKPFKTLLTEKDVSVPENLSHPIRYREFLANADGVTVIIDKLNQFVPSQIPTLILWPGVDTEHFFPRKHDPTLAASLGIPLNTVVICYTGNVHAANSHEVRSVYLAVAMMNREGQPARLIRTGRDFYEFLDSDDRWARRYSIEVGYVNRVQLPDILALANVLVQPGRADNFNNYRFPSKLPEFLAMGKPVVLPKANIGHLMKHGQDALVFPVVDALHIVDSVKLISQEQDLSNRLSHGAVNFAKTHLNWRRNSEALKSFYESL